MVALRLWVVSEWRRRWASLLLVAMIVAIGGGAVLLSLNGARRADTAFERFFDRVGAPNVEAEASLPESGDLGRFTTILDRLDEIDDLPGVERAFVSAWMLVGVKGQQSGYYTPVPIVSAGMSDAWQSVVVEGRLPALDEADAIVVNEEAARSAGVGVGDRLTLESLAPGQGLEYLSGDALPEPRGPSVDVTIVGVIRGGEDISDTPSPTGRRARASIVPMATRSRPACVASTCGPSRVAKARSSPPCPTSSGRSGSASGPGPATTWPAGSSTPRPSRPTCSGSRRPWRPAPDCCCSCWPCCARMPRWPTSSRSGGRSASVPAGTRWRRPRSILPFAVLGVVGAVGLTAALSPLLPQGRARRAEVDPGVWLDAPLVLAGAVLMAAVVLVCAALVGGSPPPGPRRGRSRRPGERFLACGGDARPGVAGCPVRCRPRAGTAPDRLALGPGRCRPRGGGGGRRGHAALVDRPAGRNTVPLRGHP